MKKHFPIFCAFLAAALSLIFFRTLPGTLFYPALIIMILGTYLLVCDQKE